MSLRDLALPATDAVALVQALAAVPVPVVALIAVRGSRDRAWFVPGLAVMTDAWFALLTVH